MSQRYERIVGRSITRIGESQHDTRISDADQTLQITAAWSVSALCKAKVGHRNALNVCTRFHAIYTIPERILAMIAYHQTLAILLKIDDESMLTLTKLCLLHSRSLLQQNQGNMTECLMECVMKNNVVWLALELFQKWRLSVMDMRRQPWFVSPSHM